MALAKGRGGGRPQGQKEQRAAPQGELRGLGELDPQPQVVHPVRAIVLESGRGQTLLDGGQLAEIVVAHQDQAAAGFEEVDGPHQGVQAPGEEHHRLGPPGVGPVPLEPQVNPGRAEL